MRTKTRSLSSILNIAAATVLGLLFSGADPLDDLHILQDAERSHVQFLAAAAELDVGELLAAVYRNRGRAHRAVDCQHGHRDGCRHSFGCICGCARRLFASPVEFSRQKKACFDFHCGCFDDSGYRNSFSRFFLLV